VPLAASALLVGGLAFGMKQYHPHRGGAWMTVNLANPPAPMPESSSPYYTPESPVQLELTAKVDTWVEVETDGAPAFAKLLLASQTKSFAASGRVRLVVGNAAGVEAKMNGKQIGPIGKYGQRMTVELTPAGYQFGGRQGS
jgi:hypothetical protein